MEKYRIHSDVGVYFVTFTVVEWLPVFVDEASCKIIVDSLNFCHEKKFLRINAYVIMPTHLHAILFDAEFDSVRLKHTLDDFRKFTGRQLLDFSVRFRPASLMEVFLNHAGGDRQRRFWQPTRHPEGIRTDRFWKQKLDYIHDNPRRKGLVKSALDWRFSSASFWFDGENQNDVILSAIGWD
jgi:REP element-mobilizing transposase RayT